MGLMAIHLILKAADQLWPGLCGQAVIYSDCLGALKKVATFPPHKIPARCWHSDILKNIMIHCTSLSFALTYSHVKAHQDDNGAFKNMPRHAQLNVYCDSMDKHEIWELSEELPCQKSFPLEPVTVWIGKDKLSSDTADSLRFWVHKQLVGKRFYHLNILSPQQFKEIARKQVHDALCEAPRMFQIVACKQVNDIAGVNVNLARYTPYQDTACPSCGQEVETCYRILHCEEEGTVAALNCTIDHLDSCLKKVGIHNSLR